MSIVGDLTGRVALVTGAGAADGIGFATAVALGELGASLVVTATSARIHDRASDLSELGIPAIGVVADLTEESAVSSLRDEVFTAFGRIDVLVNNAGMTSVILGSDRIGDVAEITSDQWHAGLARNLDTAFLVTRACFRDLVAQGWGRIVMVSSTTGPISSMVGHSVYATAKAAMVGLMRTLALEGAAHGVTANAVGPGWIDTGSATDDERRYGAACPIGRSGRPDEVAAVIASLCLPGMSYLSGQLVIVDGANSVIEARTPSD